MSAAVMPMRSVPCEKAGAVEAARRPKPTAARRRCLNIHYSPIQWRDMQGSSQATAACRLHVLRRREGTMSSPKAPTLEEFRARAALTGLTLTPEDIEHLHKGYVGLLDLMQRIPTHWAWAAE